MVYLNRVNIWEVNRFAFIISFMSSIPLFSYFYFGSIFGIYPHIKSLGARDSTEMQMYGLIYFVPLALMSYLFCILLNVIRNKFSKD